MLKKILKMRWIIIALLLFLLVILSQNAYAASSLPEQQEGKIVLKEDVTLNESVIIEKTEDITIDLAGYALTGPENNYTIDNRGTLKIIDSGKNKGRINGIAPSASCVRNMGNLSIEGIKIDTISFGAVKNEENSVANIKDSTLNSIYVLPAKSVTGTVINYGTMNITNSEVKANSSASFAVWAASMENENSITTINNSTLEGKQTVYCKRNPEVPNTSKSTQTVSINGGELKGRITGMTSGGASISISGNVKVTEPGLSDVLGKAKEGTNVILTSNLTSGDKTVPAGVTLTIAKGVTYKVSASSKLVVKGNLKVEGTLDAAALVVEANTYHGTLQKAVSKIDTSKNIVVLKELKETVDVKPYANKDVTINLNGHTVEANIINVAGTTMAIKDDSKEKTGKVIGTITNNDKLTLESGNFVNATLTTAENAKTNFVGGTYSSIQLEDVELPGDKELKANEDNSFTIDYKSADYTAVNTAKEKYNKLDKTKYTEESFKAVTDAINAIIEGKNITEQEQVDEMAIKIEKAISELKRIYTYIEGAKQETKKDNEISFKIDAEMSKVEKVLIDGTAISKDNYILTKGSTIVTLNKEYVATLSDGEHKVVVEFTDGIAETTFKLTTPVIEDENKGTEENIEEEKKEEQPKDNKEEQDNNKKEEENPKTFDSILGYSLIGIISIVGLAGCVVTVKRTNANGKH